MTAVYLDSSVLVSIAIGDTRGFQTLSLLGSRTAYTSELSPVECQAGISFKYASASSGLPAAEQAINRIFERIQMVGITSAILNQARTLVRRHRAGIGLRTLDALHIASCIEIRSQLDPSSVEYITADRRQHTAFMAEGFLGTLLS